MKLSGMPKKNETSTFQPVEKLQAVFKVSAISISISSASSVDSFSCTWFDLSPSSSLLFSNFLFFCLGFRHCVKSVQIRSFFWSVFSCIQNKYRKIQTRKNSVFGHLSRSAFVFKIHTTASSLVMKIHCSCSSIPIHLIVHITK